MTETVQRKPRKPRRTPQWQSFYRTGEGRAVITMIRRAVWKKIAALDDPTLRAFCREYDVDFVTLRRFLTGIDDTYRGRVTDEFVMDLAGKCLRTMPDQVMFKIIKEAL